MSDFKSYLSFQSCWNPPDSKNVKPAASGYFGVPSRKANQEQSRTGSTNATTISPADKARLTRVAKGAPEVMVKITRPAKIDRNGNPISVSRVTEGARVGAHIDYISRNGKVDLETDDGIVLTGKEATAELYEKWMEAHDDNRANGFATDRTRITTGIVLSMPFGTSPNGVLDAAKALASQEFGGRHHYVMALHTDGKQRNPHVHLTVRTVGHDGVKLNLRKPDLQRLRDTFAEKLRTRGIEAESTPRLARGVTRKGERTPVRKVREKGKMVSVDAAKRREVERDLIGNNGRLPSKEWDSAILRRRNDVMRTYYEAARLLEKSNDLDDQQLASSVKRFAGRMTDVTTERAVMARDAARGLAVERPTVVKEQTVGSRDQVHSEKVKSRSQKDRDR